MKRNILSLCLSLVVVSTIYTNVKAQSKASNSLESQTTTPPPHIKGEQLEKVLSFWSLGMEQVRVAVGAEHNEFYKVFQNFNQAYIDSLHREFLHKVWAGTVNMSNVKEYINEDKPQLVSLYKKFTQIETEFPTSVEEYKTEHRPRIGKDSCFSTCYNTNFGDGTFDGWYGYYAVNNSGTAAFNITGITGGYLGAVKKAAFDPNTGTYQMRITAGTATDVFLNTYSTYSMPQVSPFGGNYSVMLGDSSRNGQGTAILSQSFLVTSNTANLTYQYSVFLENPAGHSYTEQPFFTVGVLDQNGDTIPICGQYSVDGDSARYKGGFKGVYYTLEGDSVYWRNWTFVNVPLKKYLGQCVTLVFEDWDCALGGHFGYAYVSASCTPLGLIASSPNFCGQDSILLTAPVGAASYTWSCQTWDTIDGNINGQSVWVKDSGTYTVVCIPVTGAACADTLTITVGKAPGPPPHPSFHADSVCAGQPTTFFNTSTPTNGQFYWDFYDIGVYNLSDTTNFNPTWTYVSPGTYKVKLHEVYNGCGYDTVISVVVAPIPAAGFSATGGCVNSPITFNNTSTGATKYLWNFGQGPLDTSTAVSPVYTYTATGTYTVTLVCTNAGHCNDTIQQTIVISPIPKPIITGTTPVCPGTRDTLSVTGGTTYIWVNNGNTNSSIQGIPTITTTYTVEAFNGTCEHDTTFTITMIPAPSPTITVSKDSVCKGDTITLEGAGATTYKWLPGGNTTTKISVNINKVDTFLLVGYGGVCTDTAKIVIGLVKTIKDTAITSVDSICPGGSAILTATVSGAPAVSYAWSPGGGTTSSITVNPTSTTTYTATVVGKCNTVTNKITVTVVPLSVPTISGQNWECKGTGEKLTVSSTNPPNKYLWSNGNTSSSYTTGPIDGDTSLYVISTNKLGCPDTTRFSILERLKPVIKPIPNAIECNGSTVTLQAEASGAGPFTYSWSPGGATTSSITIDSATSQTYTVTVSNGCPSTATAKIIPDAPPLSACCDHNIIIGDDTVIGAYGKGILKYQWVDSNGVVCLNPPLCDSIKVTPTVTTTYTCIGTDSMGCQVERFVTITVEIPCFNITVPNVFTPDYAGQIGTNGGTNNVFYIQTQNIDAWSIIIYDRWGKEMFKSNNPDVYWTGVTESGGKAPDGVYYYIITGTCQQRTYKKDGFLQLIR